MAKKKILYNIELNGDTHIHVSHGNDKLGDGIYNISLLPGSKPLTLKNGKVLTNICGTCTGCDENCLCDCYAAKFVKFHHNSCVPAYGDNTVLALQDPELYFREIENYLNKSWIGCWRWHVSGEIPNYEYLVGMNKLAIKFPYITFYFYSKRYQWLEMLETSQGYSNNLVPTVSTGWGDDYDNPYNFHEFILDTENRQNVIHCPAIDKNGHETGVTCAVCKRCPLAKRGMKTYCFLH